jgi:2,3-bisphosphoglycerate-dependent phosphoglycerate mutase
METEDPSTKTFTGWSDDADFTDQGTREMEHAARLLMEPVCEIDIVFTARLKRAIRSTARAQSDSLTGSSWRINERH